MSEAEKTVTLTIDGVEHKVPAGVMVLKAALERQVEIPYFCYHPYLSVPGNCRQCQVKVGMKQEDGSVKWMPKLQVSCNTRVADGMVVLTTDDEVVRAQKANMEFLLINHPLDCPICDQVGECWLQEHAFTAGRGETRFREQKIHFDKRVDVGPHVLLDKERCIQCTRCIRFCDEVTGTSELALFSRGNHTEVDIFPGRPLDNPYSGNVVDICPVGALTLKEFRFNSRLWFMKTENSVCPGCARGCSIKVWHKDRHITRITPRHNPEVNRTWICDHGRLIGQELESGERMAAPRVAGQDVPWEQALDEAASRLQAAGGKAAAILHPWSTLEEGWLALQALEAVAGAAAPVAVPAHDEGEDDDLLIRADKSPNRRGLTELAAARGAGPHDLGEILDRAVRGEFKALLVLGEDLDAGREGWLDKARAAGVEVVALASHESATTAGAGVALAAGTFPEIAGTVVNFQGRAQAMRAAYPPPRLARPGAWILSRLAARLGAGEPDPGPRQLFESLAAAVPALDGLSYAAVHGVRRPLPTAAMAGSGRT